MKCLETRTRRDGLRYRRYRDSDGAIHHTVEVPAEVWRSINGQGRSHDRLASYERRRARLRLRAEAVRLIEDGWKSLAVAHELHVALRTVQRWAVDTRGITAPQLRYDEVGDGREQDS